MFDQFHQRSLELEHLDKGDYTAEEYEGCLVELRRVNRWLGDARALRSSLLSEIEKTDRQTFSVVDVGAGSGELLRVIAKWSRSSGRNSELVGVELNPDPPRRFLSSQATFRKSPRSAATPSRLPFADNQFDYAICSLFTHHFRDGKVVRILRELGRVAARRHFRDRSSSSPCGLLFLHDGRALVFTQSFDS